MPTNQDLAAIFEQISHLLELTGADKFRVNAHARAARAIADCSTDLMSIAHDRAALMAIDGIGPRIADKIREFAETGSIKEHQDLLKEVPSGLLEVLAVPGLGPKTVRVLWKEKQVKSLDDLKRIIADGSIMELPRMGEKTVQNIRESISFMEQSSGRMPLGMAMPIAESVLERLRAVKGVHAADFAGSLRRGRETIGDLDFVAASDDPKSVHAVFTAMPEVEKVLASGESKCSVRLKVQGRRIQADLRVVPPESYGAALLYFTGSKEHNVRLRGRALRMGLTLNEYGLFPLDDAPTPPQARGVRAVAGKTEESVYQHLGLSVVPPELREDRGEVSDGWQPPKLVELKLIRAELHAHTSASDGTLSIDQLAEMAEKRGFHTIAVTDHSQSSTLANGLKPERLRAHIRSIREAAERHKRITILAGAEVDIHADGTLDYDDELLAELDIVVASPHASLRQDPALATRRLVAAVSHPLVHMLGHATGRLLGRREGLHPDIKAVAEAAAAHRTALEVNANWLRLDLCDVHVRTALEAGGENALIAIDCDVHHPADFDQLRFGVMTARRGGLPADRCVNCWTARKLHAWLKSKR